MNPVEIPIAKINMYLTPSYLLRNSATPSKYITAHEKAHDFLMCLLQT
jgi:hypothetical protein